MKKKIFAAVMVMTLLAAQAMGVCAAGSRTANVIPAGDSVGRYEITPASEETFGYLQESAPEALSLIMEVQDGTKDIADIIEAAPELKDELEGKRMITNFFDLEPINGGIKNEAGHYVVTLSVPEMTEAMTNIRILHYSTDRQLWEVIEPESVDYAAKELVAIFEDLSPVAIISDVDESKIPDSNSTNGGKGTSPQTGVESVWGIYMTAAGILLAAAGGFYIKARRKQRNKI